MPPKGTPSPAKDPSSTNGGGLNLTAREAELMVKAMQCLETEPKLDVNKFAQMAGFTNVRSGTNAWLAIKKKIGLKAGGSGGSVGSGGAGSGGGTTTPGSSTKTSGKKTPGTTTTGSRNGKRKSAPVANGEDDSGDGDGDGDQEDEREDGTPSKRVKREGETEIKNEPDADGTSDDELAF